MVVAPPVRYFRKLVLKHLNILVNSIDLFGESYISFTTLDSIYPIHCDQVLNVLGAWQVTVQQICELLEQPSEIPLVIEPLRYKPLVTLRYIDENLYELKEDITLLRSNCLHPNRQTKQYQKQIQENLEKILSNKVIACQQVQSMLDVALFQENGHENSLESSFNRR